MRSRDRTRSSIPTHKRNTISHACIHDKRLFAWYLIDFQGSCQDLLRFLKFPSQLFVPYVISSVGHVWTWEQKVRVDVRESSEGFANIACSATCERWPLRGLSFMINVPHLSIRVVVRDRRGNTYPNEFDTYHACRPLPYRVKTGGR